MNRAPVLRRRALALALGVALAVPLAAAPALAASPKEVQAQKALKQALEEDYLETRFDAAEQRLRAAIQSCGKTCSAALRARLHAALGSVLAGGKKELTDARDAFVDALSLDPKIEPNPDILSAEVTFAFEQAKKQLHLATGAADAKPGKPVKAPERPAKDEEEKPAKDEGGDKAGGDKAGGEKAEPTPPPPPPQPARKNWIAVSFSPDLAVVSGSNVCTSASRNGAHYYCVRADGSPYKGTPTVDNGDDINPGLALATMRVTLGYERLVHPNVSLGLRVGFAFNGASADGGPFVPFHAEGRLGVWLGHDPFARTGVRPYFVVAGGVEQVDAKVSVQVLENGAACGARPASSTSAPCTMPAMGDDTTEPRTQTLTVYKQSGLGFAAGGFGLMFAPSQRVGIHLAARGGVTFPVVAPVISPELGVEVGF